MTKEEFYEGIVPEKEWMEKDSKNPVRLNRDGVPLSAGKQFHLNQVYREVRQLRAVYHNDPLIKEVTTNILAGLILVDCE